MLGYYWCCRIVCGAGSLWPVGCLSVHSSFHLSVPSINSSSSSMQCVCCWVRVLHIRYRSISTAGAQTQKQTWAASCWELRDEAQHRLVTNRIVYGTDCWCSLRLLGGQFFSFKLLTSETLHRPSGNLTAECALWVTSPNYFHVWTTCLRLLLESGIARCWHTTFELQM